jgi:hypothetical protein
MRYESSVTSLSWIPSEAVTGAGRTAFDSGFTHYDDPPPAGFADIEELRAGDRFRFANVLRAWIEVDDSGRITRRSRYPTSSASPSEANRGCASSRPPAAARPCPCPGR